MQKPRTSSQAAVSTRRNWPENMMCLVQTGGGGQIVKDVSREEGFNADRVSPPRAQHARRK